MNEVLEKSNALTGKVAIITGASGSMGSAVAKRLAKEGVQLILVSRNIEKLKPLYDQIKNTGATEPLLASLDLQDVDAIKKFAESVEKQLEKQSKSLSILMSAAAILGDSGSIATRDQSMWNSVMETNFHANWHLIKSFDKMLKDSECGRIVVITSDAITSPDKYPFWGAYAASKAALETMVKIYAAENKHSSLCVNMVHPIEINSNIYTQVFPTHDTSKLVSPDELTDKLIELVSENHKFSGRSYALHINGN